MRRRSSENHGASRSSAASVPRCEHGCFADSGIGATAADVVGEGVVDVGRGGAGLAREERSNLEHHPRLAVAALGDVFLEPCSLDGMIAVGGQAFDRGVGLAGSRLLVLVTDLS